MTIHLGELKKYLILIEAEASFTERRYADNGTVGRKSLNAALLKNITTVKESIKDLELELLK